MSILHSKIKFEIDINNDDLLEIVWEHMREIKRPEGGGRGYYSIDKSSSPLSLFLSLFHIFKVKVLEYIP